MKDIQWTGEMPECQGGLIDLFGGSCHEPGEYDVPTVDGPWADLCKDHRAQYATGNMGTHRVPV